MGSRETAQLEREVETQGYSDPRLLPGSTGVKLVRWYNKYGEVLRLPADPFSMFRYMRKGYSLFPPPNPEPKPVPTVGTAATYEKVAPGEVTEEEQFTRFLSYLDKAGYELKRKDDEEESELEPELL